MFNVARKFKVGEVEEFTITSASKSINKDVTRLVIEGTDADNKPVQAVVNITSDAAQAIHFPNILAQLNEYGTDMTDDDAIEIINNHKGDKLRILCTRTEYPDVLTGEMRHGTSISFNENDF